MKTLSIFFASLSNGYKSRGRIIRVYSSKIVILFLKIMQKEGLIEGFSYDPLDHRQVFVYLKYVSGLTAFRTLKLISTAGRRVFVSKHGLRRLMPKGLFFLHRSGEGLVCVNLLSKNRGYLGAEKGGELVAKLLF